MLRNLIAAAAAAFLLAGCATGTRGKNAVELQSEPTLAVATVYGDARLTPFVSVKKWETELVRRDAFTPEQWENIKHGKIGVGDPEEVVAAAWGSPDRITTHSEVGNSGQLWYFRGDSTLRPHGVVILRGGRVASITR